MLETDAGAEFDVISANEPNPAPQQALPAENQEFSELNAPSALGYPDGGQQVNDASLPHSQESTTRNDALQGTATAPVVQATPERPQNERKVSALASLPSQQRNMSFGGPMTSRSPMSPTNRQDVDEDELYASTPTATKARSLTWGNIAAADDDLYEITPVATRAPAPWRVLEGEHLGSRIGSEDGIAQHEPQTTVGAAARDREVSRPMTADDVDRRSEVSAEEHVEPTNEHEQSKEYGPSESRRSSVSSLESPDNVVTHQASVIRMRPVEPSTPKKVDLPPVMTAQAVPAGPVPAGPSDPAPRHRAPSAMKRVMQPSPHRSNTSSHDTTPEPGFMNRSYHGRATPQERAMSYTPLGHNSSGVPTPEANRTREGSTAGQAVDVDLSGFSGPPLGTPPFGQHPFFRNSGAAAPPSEYENLRSSRPGTVTPSTMHSRQVSRETGDRTSRRYSNFFRGPTPTQDAMPGVPPPNAMTPQYGLEGLDATGTGSGTATPLRQPEDKQARRRSGLWDAFKRSPSASRIDFSRQSSIAPVDSRNDLVTTIAANKADDLKSKPNTLKKPQRAASVATPPAELKKKPRFSRLGSLFGRSNTQGHNAAKPNKLTKQAPEPLQRQGLGPSASVRGYDAYEAMRRQQRPPVQGRETTEHHVDATASSSYQHPPPVTVASEGWYGAPDNERSAPDSGSRPPSQGRYGPGGNTSPGERASAAQQPEYGQQAQRPSQFRRLHSGNFQRGLEHASIPEAFKPTEASYGRQAAPVGPLLEHQPPVMYEPPAPSRQPTLPTKQPYWRRESFASSQFSPVHQTRQHQVSSGSAGYQPSPQSYAPSEYERGQWTKEGSLPYMSPIQTRTGSEAFPSVQEHQSVGSLDQEMMARSSARNYGDQQTPWPVDMAPNMEPQGSSRAPSWALPSGAPPSHENAYPGPQRHSSGMSPSSAPLRYSLHGMPMSPQSPGASQLYNYPPGQPPASTMQGMPTYSQQRPRDIDNAQSGAYPSPPYTPQTPSQYHQAQLSYAQPPYGGQYGQHQYYPQQRPAPRQRYYVQPQQQQQQPGSRPGSRPPSAGGQLTYQRTLSGFSGRRDDATVSEQELMMRGASYPGQEWSPAHI